jgi:4-amino-4-deoxy-L-arabinose transferase-like glycosyltransferase
MLTAPTCRKFTERFTHGDNENFYYSVIARSASRPEGDSRDEAISGDCFVGNCSDLLHNSPLAMTNQKKWLWLIVLAGLALRIAAWFYFRAHTLQLVTTHLPDDALYYFTIASNLAHGYGISFDTVHPTNGMHPLWLFLITPIFTLGFTKWGLIHAVLLFQSALDAIIIWLIGSTIYDLLDNAKESNRKTAAASSALIYALSSLVIIRSINGLETTLTALLFVLWFRAYMQTASGLFKDWVALGIVTGLLMLSRTDSFIVLLPLVIFTFVTRVKLEWKSMLLALVLACVVIAPWLLWNIARFGTIIQSSAEAVPMLAMRKYEVLYGSGKYWHFGIEAARNALKPFWYAAFGLPLLTIGYAIIARRKKLSQAERGIYLLLLGGVLLLIVHSLFRGFIRDWYIEELIPIVLIGFGISIGANAGLTEARPSGRFTLAAIVIVFQLILFRDPQYTSQSQLLTLGLPTVEKLTPHAKVASFNSGYYGYFTSARGNIVNIDGVVNSEALAALKSGRIGEYLDKDSVSYILDFQGDFGGYVNLFDRHMMDGFERDSSFGNPSGGNDALALYSRKTILGQKQIP